MESRCNSIRMALTLLAVVVLSALCAAEGIIAATPRWDLACVDGATYWSAGRDRDASPSRSVRASDARLHDELIEDAADWSGSGQTASLSLRADGRWETVASIATEHNRSTSPFAQLSPHRLSLPPPVA